MTWRELIYQYLQALADDQRKRMMAESETAASRFIQEHGVESLRRWETERIEAGLAELDAPLGSPEEYRLVEESPERIVVEVEKGPGVYPFDVCRYRLERHEDQWKLAGDYWKCSCPDGKCFICKGSGVCRRCHGKKECNFCDESANCLLCKGTGACDFCVDSDIPGWRQFKGKDRSKSAD